MVHCGWELTPRPLRRLRRGSAPVARCLQGCVIAAVEFSAAPLRMDLENRAQDLGTPTGRTLCVSFTVRGCLRDVDGKRGGTIAIGRAPWARQAT